MLSDIFVFRDWLIHVKCIRPRTIEKSFRVTCVHFPAMRQEKVPFWKKFRFEENVQIGPPQAVFFKQPSVWTKAKQKSSMFVISLRIKCVLTHCTRYQGDTPRWTNPSPKHLFRFWKNITSNEIWSNYQLKKIRERSARKNRVFRLL